MGARRTLARALRAGDRRLLIPGFALFALLRIPSFLEPHWYTDEGSYVSVARALLRGRVLYTQIWNNKPPLQSWTVAAEVRLFGSSEAGLHLLTFLTGAATLAALAWAAWRLLGPRRAALATLFGALALGLPVLDAELAIPESLLIAPLTWAGALVAVHLHPRSGVSSGRRWAVLAGLLTAAAIAYQQTAVAECCAFALAIALSPQGGWRALLRFAVPVVGVTAAWVLLAISQAGAGEVGFALVGFYIAYTQSVFPTTAGGILVHLAEVGAATALIAGGALLARRLPTISWVLVLWAGAALMVAALSRQPYAHYLVPAVAPVGLLLASLHRPPRPVSVRRLVPLRLAPQLVGLVVAGSLASVAGLDWIPTASPSPLLNSSRTLSMYYLGAIAAAVNKDSRADWWSHFDSRVIADQAVADWLQRQGLSGSSAVVWSSDAWLYALADLDEQVPTPPIYNDEVLFGINGPVADQVDMASPTLIVVSVDALGQFPEVKRLLDGLRYEMLFQSDPDSVWVRGDVVASLGASPNEVAR